jgi:hypothetical protein
MRSRSFSAALGLLAVVLTALPGTPRGAWAQEVPYTGVVNQNQTDVRAGAADRYYRVGELGKGTVVEVDEVIVGWYKIVPPQGFHSYISKAFVDASGDGTSGVVNTDRSKVYAADVNGPAGSYRVQAILNEGDGVQIVSEEGSHYKIVAPANAYVYLPPGSVRRPLAIETVPAEPEEPAEAEPVEVPEPVAEPEPEPEPVVPPAEPEPVVEPVVEAPAEPEPVAVLQPEPVVEAEITEDTSQEALDDMLGETDPAPEAEATVTVERVPLPELERHFEAMRTLPLEEQPLAEMIAKYELLEAQGGLSQGDAYRVASRLALLRHDLRIAQGLEAIAAARQPAPEPDEAQQGAITYDAIGRLLAASVYDGRTLPRMFRLVDPATGRSLAYVRPDSGDHDATRFLGRLVGISGTTSYDPALKLRVIAVEQMDSLQAVD